MPSDRPCPPQNSQDYCNYQTNHKGCQNCEIRYSKFSTWYGTGRLSVKYVRIFSKAHVLNERTNDCENLYYEYSSKFVLCQDFLCWNNIFLIIHKTLAESFQIIKYCAVLLILNRIFDRSATSQTCSRIRMTHRISFTL